MSIPASLRPRRDGWTPQRQARFLAALAANHSLTSAAAAAGISVRSAYRLRHHRAGVDFAARWDAALVRPVPLSRPTAFNRLFDGESGVFDDGVTRFSFQRPCSTRTLTRLLDRATRARSGTA